MIPEYLLIAALCLVIAALLLLRRQDQEDTRRWHEKAARYQRLSEQAARDVDTMVEQVRLANEEIRRLQARLWQDVDAADWWKQGPTREDDGDG